MTNSDIEEAKTVPLFDFICPKCEVVQQDVMVSIRATKDDHPKCPDDGEVMEKLPSKASTHFKGNGFYCNEYHAPTRG